jgi:hypothetical protein
MKSKAADESHFMTMLGELSDYSTPFEVIIKKWATFFAEESSFIEKLVEQVITEGKSTAVYFLYQQTRSESIQELNVGE